MSEYVHDVAVHIEQILSGMLDARRISPSRLQRAIGLLERGGSRARARGDRHLQAVFSHCLVGLNRQPLHRITDRQLEAVVRVMRLVADGGNFNEDDVAQTVQVLAESGLSVETDA